VFDARCHLQSVKKRVKEEESVGNGAKDKAKAIDLIVPLYSALL
jgi:hypothetical protein